MKENNRLKEEGVYLEVKATFRYGDQSASGIFTFNEQYEYVLFTTNNRGVTNSDGNMEYVPWSAVCGDYHVSESGIKYPTKFQAVWNYPDGDFVYYNGTNSKQECGELFLPCLWIWGMITYYI